MTDTVTVQIPVSRAPARLLRDAHTAKRVGRLVSGMLRPTSPETDPRATLIAEIKAKAHQDGLTDAEIDAEWNK